jgi:hypothetical protein
MEKDNYKIKYLKYKKKYLELKRKSIINNDIQNGSGIDLSGVFNMVKHIPGSNLLLNSMKYSAEMLPEEQREIITNLERFVTPKNAQLFGQLVFSLLKHLKDPKFYPMFAVIVRNITMLMGSTGTANPLIIMYSLNETLGQMKVTFPEEFVLLKKFFMSNRQNIIPILKKQNPMIFNDATYQPLVEFIFGNDNTKGNKKTCVPCSLWR